MFLSFLYHFSVPNEEYKHQLKETPLTTFGKDGLFTCNYDLICVKVNARNKMVNQVIGNQKLILPHIQVIHHDYYSIVTLIFLY